ncbi:MAG: SAM-dependent chlorinase/fluorinase [Bacteroidia bacterium]|nr:SAM-dependent chlorinase/fluorinase [Bacteroidia bacterium]MDW8301552.1 SAM-dependent chlorinase/fluorinase [Bacteroidia bacterium]
MGIVTLTSDFGANNYLIARLKGAILAELPSTQIIDVSHSISPFNIIEAAYVFKNVFMYYPEQTVHLIMVQAQPVNSVYVYEHQQILCAKINEQYVLCLNNGTLTLALSGYNYEVKLSAADKPKLYVSWPDMIKIAVQLLKKPEQTWNKFLQAEPKIIKKDWQKPVVIHGDLQGVSIHIDGYGNLVTNITQDVFEDYVGNEPFSIRVRSVVIDKVVKYRYQEINGSYIAYFNDLGYLTLSVNYGNFADIMGIVDPVPVVVSKTRNL